MRNFFIPIFVTAITHSFLILAQLIHQKSITLLDFSILKKI